MGQLITTGYHDDGVAEAAIGHSTAAVDGPVYNGKVMLFSNHLTITKDTKVADLTEATFSGYAKSAAVVFPPPIRNPDGSYSVIVPTTVFQAGTASPFVPDTVVGAALVDHNTPGKLLAAGLFDAPVVMDTVNNGCVVDMVINYGGDPAQSVVQANS